MTPLPAKLVAVRYLALQEDRPDYVRYVLDQMRRRKSGVNLRHHGIDRLNDDTLEQLKRNARIREARFRQNGKRVC